MTPRAGEDREMRYLLGEISDEERTALEEEYFSQDESFQRLKEAEDDLVDAYARGTLSPERRTRFEERYLTTSAGRERLEFAQALGSVLARDRPGQASLPPRPARATPRWPTWAAGLATAAAVVLAFQVVGLRTALRRAETEKDTLRFSAAQSAQQDARNLAEVKREVEELRTRTAGLEEVLGAADATRVATLDLDGGLARDLQPVPLLALAPNTAVVRLNLRLKTDPHPEYRAAIETSEGRPVWTRAGLRSVAGGNRPLLRLAVPAAALAAGHYVVVVSGTAPAAGSAHAEYVFRVRRP